MRFMKIIAFALLMATSAWAGAATCTSLKSDNWSNASTWSCDRSPTSADAVVITSPYTVTLNGKGVAGSLVIDSGATIDDQGKDLQVSGNIVVNGQFGLTGGGTLISTGASPTISGSGTFFNDATLEIHGNATIPVGSSLTFTGQSQIDVNKSSATLVINGTISGAGQQNGNTILDVKGSVTINGQVNAPQSHVSIKKNAVVVNDGTVTLQAIKADSNSAQWNQGANASLTLSQTGDFNGKLSASATGNTVSYAAGVTPIIPSDSNRTYFNLIGPTCAVVTSLNLTVLGSSPCASNGMICYTDNFSNLANWSVGNVGGSFGNPVALNNRLRLTDASGDVSTYATLNKLFPAFGNKIVVQFTDYAYGGTDPGADGIGIVLSDASVAPVAGAFGGSLGYAPKQVALGGDTTHPGFTGGWLGVGIDEYGNYSANTEGRTGGSAPGVTPESVAVRGSGSGYTGYAYMTGTSSLSPLGIDTNASGDHLMTSGPGYKYRITVDHSDSIHAMTSVERDTGSGYVTLIQPFDAKAVSGQAGVPTDWYLSFTGATGGANNIHEIANLSVCSNSQQTVSLDHLELDHDATACGSDDVTVKACGNASCSVLYLGKVTATLTATGASGASWSANPVSFSGGQTTVTLTGSTGSTYTLGTSSVSPTPANATQCVGGPSGSACNITFVSACFFDAVETGQAPATPIYTKLSGTAFNLDVLAVSGSKVNTSYAGTVSVSLVDPTAASGNCADTATGLTSSASFDFTGQGGSKTNGRIPVSFNYPYAARDVRVRIVSNSQPVCSSDDFAIRPRQLALSTTSTYPVKAGANFNLIANLGVSSGYTGTPLVDATQIVDHNNVTIASGALTGSFPAATGAPPDTSSGSFQYQDVGTLSLKTNAVTDPNFTAVDQVTGVVGKVDHGASGDCVLNNTSNSLSNSRYGCTIGAAGLGPLGRFYPDHYEVNASLTPACAAGGFSYMSQPALGISLGVSAMSSSGVLLSRYTTGGNFSGLCSPNSCLATLDIEGDNAGVPINPLSARLSPNLPGSLPASTAWSAGQYTASGSAYSFNRLVAPDGPYDNFALKVSVADNDGALITKLNGATVTGSASVLSPLTKIRYGRLQIANAYGSELLALPVNVSAQYWNGSAYVPNSLDSCTSIASTNFTQTPGPGAAITTTILGGGTLSSGAGAITLTKPAPAPSGKGSVNLASTIAWLPGSGRATFGIAASPFIYLRENY